MYVHVPCPCIYTHVDAYMIVHVYRGAGRSSKAIEELQIPGMGRPNPADTRIGDTAILNVVEAYCNTARFKTLIRKLIEMDLFLCNNQHNVYTMYM